MNNIEVFFIIKKWLIITAHLIIVTILLINVKKRKKTEKVLKESKERLKILINATPDIICFKDENGQWLECNEAIQKIFDLKNDEWRGKTDIELSKMDSFFEKTHMKCLSTDEMACKKGEILRIEEQIITKDGKVNIFDTIKSPLYYEDGRKKGVILIGRDITERKEAEEKFKESEKLYKKLIDFFPEAIFTYINGKSMPINKEALNLLGIKSFEEFKDKNVSDFIIPHSDYKDIINEANKQLSEHIAVQSLDCKMVRKDGVVFDIEFSGFSINYNNTLNYIVVLKNVTDKKKNKELKEKADENRRLLLEAKEYDKIKTEFMANISHELRTPLNVILSTLQLLELYISDGKIIDKFDQMNNRIYSLRQNGYRLLRLVNNVIDITKIDAGFLNIKLGNYNIINIVEDITLSIADYVENMGISLIFDTDLEEKIISCDPDKIERIMLNLLSNSVKFTKPGGNITVYIKDKVDGIEILVKDTGIGIPKEKLEVIFDRFRQVDKSLARECEGSGIGLYLVKSLVEMNEGRISVKSELGKGSEFIIYLPCKLVKCEEEEDKNISLQCNQIERIHLEFSDIYT